MLLQCLLLLFHWTKIKCMDSYTKDMLTPIAKLQEFCGYESCPQVYDDMINVHIVPHTHAELGYTKTFDQHYDGHDDTYVKSNINMARILDYVITELWTNEERKFTISDMPYFFHWWSRRDGTVQRMVYTLIRQGRLHFVGGGWGMPDEACTNYQALIDQFTFNLRKINTTFLNCGRPLVAWQADVLGHSREFTSLMAQMGFDGLFLNPISFEDEIERMSTRALEFVWRGSDDLGAETDIYTHKLFDGYWTPPGFCFGALCQDPLLITSDTLLANINERVDLFIESARHRQAPFYNTNNIMVIMGKRFAYHDAAVWFANIDKLINHVNQKSFNDGSNVRLFYSTPACYLKAVHNKRPLLQIKQDDFFPYGYDKFSYATGSYTSRPSLKVLAKEGNIYLQIIKQLQVVANLGEYKNVFHDLNWINGVIQDHNVITGSLRSHVKDYYVHKMYLALQKSTVLIKNAFNKLQGTPKNMTYYRCSFNISSCRNTNGPRSFIVVYNPLAWQVSLPVRLPVRNFDYVVFDPKGQEVQSSIMPLPRSVVNIPRRNTTADHELVFVAENLPPIGYCSYYIEIRNILTSRSKRAAKIDVSLKNFKKNKKLDRELYDHIIKTSKGTEVNQLSKVHKSIMPAIETNYTKFQDIFYQIIDSENNNNKIRTKEKNHNYIINDKNYLNNRDKYSKFSKLGNNYKHKNETYKRSYPKLIIDNKSVDFNFDNYKSFIPVEKFNSIKLENSSDLEISTPRVLTKYEGDITNRIFNHKFINDNETYTEYEVEYDEIINETESLNDNIKKIHNRTSTEYADTQVLPIENKLNIVTMDSRRLLNDDLKDSTKSSLTSVNDVYHEIKLQTLPDDFERIEYSTKSTSKQIHNTDAITTRHSYTTTEFIAKTTYDTNSFSEPMPTRTKLMTKKDDNVSHKYKNNRISISSVLLTPNVTKHFNSSETFKILDKQSLKVKTNSSRFVNKTRNVHRKEKNRKPTEYTFQNKVADRRKKYYYEDSNDLFIENKFVRVTIDPATRKIARINLSNDISLEFDIQFYYYESDEPRKTGRKDRQPGAYIFKPLDTKPVPIIDFVDTRILKNDIVQEIHCIYSDYASFNLKLYKVSRIIEVDWVIGSIPIDDGLGKDVFVRYMTDLVSQRTFYTDSNGRQTIKRIRDERPTFIPINLDKIAGNYYPVTSKISIEDLNKNIRLSIFPDRTQGGTSLYDGEIDLMLNRRILTDDSGIEASLDEIEEGKGVFTRGKHYIYISKSNSDYGRVVEKKFAKELQLQPQIFVSKKNVYGDDTRKIWFNHKNKFVALRTKLPLGIHLLTLEKWGEDLLIRLENYLEILDFPGVAAKIVKLKNIFNNIEIVEAQEMTLAANIQIKDWVPLHWHTKQKFYKNFNEFYGGNREEFSDKEQLNPIIKVDLNEGLTLAPQQIRTFVVKYTSRYVHNIGKTEKKNI